MNSKLRIAFTLFVLFFFIIGVIKVLTTDEKEENKLQLEWACMDGCYNMLQIISGTKKLDDIYRPLHKDCADVCYKQYLEGVYP